jgi:hypothetical protein
MGAPALRAAGVALGGRSVLPRLVAVAGAALLALLVLIVAPLALLSSPSGSSRITRGGAGEIPVGLVAVFNEAARVYHVSAYLLVAIADQESVFGTGAGWRVVNRAGCVGLMQICVGGRGGNSWAATKDAFRRGRRPSEYSFRTRRHPDVLDSFDAVMAAAVWLRGKVGGQPIPRLDARAYRALCGYYGACADGIAGNYAADVLARARSWQHQSATPAAQSGGQAVLVWPVRGPVSSPFCERRAWEACHPGVDIAVPTGTPILAAATGRVSLVQTTASSGGYGNYTCLQHPAALSTCYAHQHRVLVRVGELVRRGQVVGISDCTGRCYGPHLHFEVRLNGQPVCPAAYLDASVRSMCAPGAPGA